DNPMFDVFTHVDYYHFWLSHFIIALGSMLLITLISVANVFVPFASDQPRSVLITLIGAGVFSAIIIFTAITNYRSPQKYYMRQMKSLIGLFFLIHVVIYFVRDPDFSTDYGTYWFIFTIFLTMVLMAVFVERPVEPTRLIYKLTLEKSKLYLRYLRNVSKKMLFKGE
ncbi:MAG: hypothetical protein M3Q81_05305, partial [bacterium]|nr:hypothetical protein [bacterium]